MLTTTIRTTANIKKNRERKRRKNGLVCKMVGIIITLQNVVEQWVTFSEKNERL